MVRKQIYLEDRQETRLKRLARELGVSEAAVIRQSLDRGLSLTTVSARNPRAWETVKACIHRRLRKGPLLSNPPSLRKRGWRREDLYDR